MFNSLMPDGNKNITHTSTKLQLLAAGLFKYVWPFSYHQALKRYKTCLIKKRMILEIALKNVIAK